MIDTKVSLVRVSREAQGPVDQLRSDNPIAWFLRTVLVGFTAWAPSLSQICSVGRTCPAGSFCPQISLPLGIKEGEPKPWIMKTCISLCKMIMLKVLGTKQGNVSPIQGSLSPHGS